MAARRQTRESVEAALREAIASGRWAHDLLGRLPAGVDPSLVADAALALFDARPWAMARKSRRLPVAAIRELVARLPERNTPWATFVRVLVDPSAGDDALAARWTYALDAMLSLDTTYAWGSKPKKAKIRALAEDLDTLAAVQATAAAHPLVRLDLLAVLAFDGSEASVDALVPHFGRAADSRDAMLDRLAALKVHARPTPAVNALLESVTAMLTERKASSPALELPPLIGLGPLDVFWFSGWFGSVEKNGNRVPKVQGGLTVDSRHANWFSISLSEVQASFPVHGRRTAFNAEKVHADELGLGTCTPAELPAWLARAMKTLDVTLDAASLSPRTHLRGKKRERLIEWLRGG